MSSEGDVMDGPGQSWRGGDVVSRYIVYMYENFNNKYKLKFKKEKKLISL